MGDSPQTGAYIEVADLGQVDFHPDLVNDIKQASATAQGALSASTRKANRWAVGLFEAYCADRNIDTAQAGHLVICAWIESQARRGLAPSTIRTLLAGLRNLYRRADHDPTRHPDIDDWVAAFSRESTHEVKRARPLRWADLARIEAHTFTRRKLGKSRSGRQMMESTERALRRGTLDCVIAWCLYDGLLRRGELLALRWCDLASAEDGGLGGLVATIRRSKTDQTGEGATVYLGPEAAKWLAKWRELSQPASDDELVVGLSGNHLQRRIRRAGEAAGIEGLTGHSGRRGMCQDLVAEGASLAAVMDAGRWKSSDMVSIYTRGQSAAQGAVAQLHAKRSAASG